MTKDQKGENLTVPLYRCIRNYLETPSQKMIWDIRKPLLKRVRWEKVIQKEYLVAFGTHFSQIKGFEASRPEEGGGVGKILGFVLSFHSKLSKFRLIWRVCIWDVRPEGKKKSCPPSDREDCCPIFGLK